MRTGVVGETERADDELSRLDGFDLAADFDDHAAVFVAHVGRAIRGLKPAVRPQVRPADARGRQLDDGVGGLEDFRLFDVLVTHIAGAVQDSS
jgi:hypothetical protein